MSHPALTSALDLNLTLAPRKPRLRLALIARRDNRRAHVTAGPAVATGPGGGIQLTHRGSHFRRVGSGCAHTEEPRTTHRAGDRAAPPTASSSAIRLSDRVSQGTKDPIRQLSAPPSRWAFSLDPSADLTFHGSRRAEVALPVIALAALPGSASSSPSPDPPRRRPRQPGVGLEAYERGCREEVSVEGRACHPRSSASAPASASPRSASQHHKAPPRPSCRVHYARSCNRAGQTLHAELHNGLLPPDPPGARVSGYLFNIVPSAAVCCFQGSLQSYPRTSHTHISLSHERPPAPGVVSAVPFCFSTLPWILLLVRVLFWYSAPARPNWTLFRLPGAPFHPGDPVNLRPGRPTSLTTPTASSAARPILSPPIGDRPRG